MRRLYLSAHIFTLTIVKKHSDKDGENAFNAYLPPTCAMLNGENDGCKDNKTSP